MRVLAGFCALLALGPAPAAAAWRACAAAEVTRPAPAPPGAENEGLSPTPENTSGCRQGVSLTVGDATIWRCQALPGDGEDDIPEDAPPYLFLIDRPGQPRQTLRDNLMAGRFRSFEVITVDLDGDGTRERVLAAWNGQGNGLGVNSWTVRVFDRDWKLIGQFDEVSDWGDSSLTRAPRGRPGCDVAVTGFVESTNRRGVQGISFRAVFHRLAGGRMEVAPDHPAVQRRYDFAFQRQRNAHFDRGSEERGNPGAWLANAPPAPR